MKEQLITLYKGGQFSQNEAKELMLGITSNKYTNEEVAAFLMALNMRPLVVKELLGFREAMLEQAYQVDLSDYNTVDIVGTGGDGKNTFNISTCTSFVVAGAGFQVAKHGSYAVSSTSGSANVLLELGIKFTNNEQILKSCLEQANICFLFAPYFHPAMKYVVPIRKALRIKTVFNILGPLINPTKTKFGIYGVYSEEIGDVFHQVLKETDIDYSVVFAKDGYDEISLTGDALVWNRQQKGTVSPRDFSYQPIQPKSIFGGNSVKEAATILEHILENKATREQKEVVVANAAFVIQTVKSELSLQACKQIAIQSIESGAAYNSLQVLRRISNL